MIIDDEHEVLEQVKEFLKDDNIDILMASTSREALDFLDSDDAGTVDLLLIDTPMPGGSNAGLFSMKPHTKMDAAGIDRFLKKPFTREELRNFVKDTLE